MSTCTVGVKLHSSGWWGSNRNSCGGLIVGNALEAPAPAARARARATAARATGWAGVEGAAGAVDRRVGDRMVRVEGVDVGVGDQDVGRELADGVGDPQERVIVDLQR